MTFQTPPNIPFLYLAQEDLYRLGNAASPKFDNVRSQDVTQYEKNGIIMVAANGKGISLTTEAGLARFSGGWLWKIPSGTQLPAGLGFHNDRGDHYMICPTKDMPLDSFKALLCEVALRCERIRKA